MKRIILRVKQLLYFGEFSAKAVKTYIFRFSNDFVLRGIKNKTVHVLGNGPSLEKSLSLIKKNDSVVMVNFSMLTDVFFKLKPKYLCLADPALFSQTTNVAVEEKKKKMHLAFKKVDWDLVIIVPVLYKKPISMLLDQGTKISVKCVNNIPIDFSVNFMRFWFYKKNLAIPSLQNVIALAIYSVLQSGYKTVYLHGVDSDSYKKICINSSNEMVLRESHYYGKEYRNLNKEGFHGLTVGRLYKRLECEVNMFRSYVDLSNYAKYLNVNIINVSPYSMIDAFERRDPQSIRDDNEAN